MKPNSVTVRDQLRTVFRRKWALILPAIVGAALVIPVWLLAPEKYMAVAQIRRRDLAVLNAAPESLVSRQGPSVTVDTLRAQLLNWQNLRRVMEQDNVGLDAGMHTPKDWQNTYDELRKAIEIRRVKAQDRGVDIIQVAVVWETPRLAAAIANAVADNYLETTKHQGRSDTKATVKFFEDKKKEYLDKLHETEDKLEKFRKDSFADLPQVKNTLLGKRLVLSTEKTARTLQLSAMNKRLDEAKKQIAEVPETTLEKTTEKNPALLRIENELEQLRRVLSAVTVGYTDEHPKVDQLKKQIAELEQQLEDMPKRVDADEREVANPVYQELVKNRMSLEQDIRGHEAALLEIESRITANDDALKEVAGQEKVYNDLTRQNEEYSNLYEKYRDEWTAAVTRWEVQEAEQEYGVEVEMLAPALEPALPYQLPRQKLALACIVGGIALGVALMFGLEFCDRSFRGIDDASAFLNIPVLGSVPTIISPAQRAKRRRTSFMIAGVAIVALAAVAGLLVLLHLAELL